MKKLMQIMILSCWRATYFSSIKNFRRLNIIRRFQLWIHLNMCKDCHEFDHQSELIDASLSHLQRNGHSLSNDQLSDTKRTSIKTTVNQQIS